MENKAANLKKLRFAALFKEGLRFLSVVSPSNHASTQMGESSRWVMTQHRDGKIGPEPEGSVGIGAADFGGALNLSSERKNRPPHFGGPVKGYERRKNVKGNRQGPFLPI